MRRMQNFLSKLYRKEAYKKTPRPTIPVMAEPGLSAELFSDEQMAELGKVLARSHHLTDTFKPGILLKRIAKSEKNLFEAHHILLEATSSGHHITPAGEWLLDNFYLIEEHIRIIKRYLPKDYEKGLPQLTGTTTDGNYPRIYDIALQIIEHGDGLWTLENLNRFIAAYQSITPLKLGELWALPIMIRAALIENLSRVSEHIIVNWHGHNLANYWADQMVDASISDPKKMVLVIADMVRSEPPMIGAFVAEFTRRLQSASLAMPLGWVQQKLAEEGLTIEHLVEQENTQQTIQQASVSNSITGLRLLGETNWRDFVEKISLVEQTLRKDPTGIYPTMDFTSRDRYRHMIEKLARGSDYTELEIATIAVELAQEHNIHLGYFLIDKGLPVIENKLDFRASLGQKILVTIRKWPLTFYLGSVTLLIAAFTSVLLLKASASITSITWLVILGIVLAITISQLAVALMNWAVTMTLKPHLLPKIDYSKGIPPEHRTLIVVPALINSIEQIESLIEALEVRFLGNRGRYLHFALLTDFTDAKQEHLPEDETILNAAKASLQELNKMYRREDEDVFFLLHRPRQWNPHEQVWMGRERKRGKLNDLNGLLRDNDRSPFSMIVGDVSIFSQVKYIITLDSDTQLPRDTALQLIGTAAHPLNQPVYSEQKKRVVRGYGIIQPRIGEALSSTGPTRYVWLSGNELGIDPYTRTISNIYQDFFNEGSFIGKGIYHVDLFQQILWQKFPDNLILSHDLLEGCYMRTGFLSDTPLYEHSPSDYLTDVKRRRRWIRGDWQIIGWLVPGRLKSNLSKWKIFDNLRRSLVAPALIVLLFLGWSILPASFFWSEVIAGLLVLPGIIAAIVELMRKPKDMLLRQHLDSFSREILKRCYRLIFYIACLPFEAWYSMDAIIRSCYRMLISRKHLLEWTPSDQVDPHFHDTRWEWVAKMWVGPVAALAGALVLIFTHRPESLWVTIVLLLLWLISPLLARWLSHPIKQREPELSTDQIRFLHKMARKTWAFFDTFVTAEDHWLPPDNYQESPVELLAHRTSPTNMGLALLANLSAYDFGYLTMRQLLDRTQNTMKTMLSLERYRGHFYNWYDTLTLEPLLPKYVSTVDDGNLCGHLLTLRQGLLELLDQPLLRVDYLDGIEDTFDLVLESTPEPHPEAFSNFRKLLQNTHEAFTSWPTAIAACDQLCEAANHIATAYLRDWPQKLLLQCTVLRDELKHLSEDANNLHAGTTLRELNTTIAQEQIQLLSTICEQAFNLAQMDVSFLYNETTRLMTIGFNVEKQVRDRSDYDLLSSEARLANFVAIAQGQVPQESWFALGRMQVMTSQGQPVMMSWSGSMFEYLMPLLVMPSYPNTLLDQVCHAAVSRHIEYGKQRGVPWGVSESAYHAMDTQSQYQYRAFGVPELGLKRGLGEDLVIAPYATIMALMVEPEAACLNLQRLAAEGAEGRFGFYEAIDFTPSRLPRHSSRMLVRTFMVHHQGMSLLAFSYFLHDKPMQRRFAADPLFQSALLLLQERIPKPAASYFKKQPSPSTLPTLTHPKTSTRVFNQPSTRYPQVQLLSNGRYHVMITQAGGGYSRWKHLAITRWREDTTCDNWGMFCYLRDVKTGKFWSTTYQPTATPLEDFKALFSESYVEFTCTEAEIETETKIVVSPEDDIELRRTKIRNRSRQRKTIEFTSYAEIVLAPQGDDLAQPTFSNLFVETEFLTTHPAVLATRRPRSDDQSPVWMCHLLNVYDHQSSQISFETNRALFVGRNNTLAAPKAMTAPGDLSNSCGTVLDPIAAIRCRVTIDPGATITFDLINGAGDSRNHCIQIVEKYHDKTLVDRIFGLSGTHSQVLLHQLDMTESQAQLYGKLASGIIYTNKDLRAEPAVLASNRFGQSKLWGYSISGDLPIVLLEIENAAHIDLVRQLVQAQSYLRRKGLLFDLVILNGERSGYRQILQEQLVSLVNAHTSAATTGGIFVRISEQIPAEDRVLLQTVAKIVLSDHRGSLREQLYRKYPDRMKIPLLKASRALRFSIPEKLELPTDLQFFNGVGAFRSDGKEYLVYLKEGNPSPAPWSNVLANPKFGTLVSDSGQGYTWGENAHEFRITPWSNDPVQDTSGEAFYLRDDETGQFWSAAALPSRGRGDYLTRHGFGYSVFTHTEAGIYSELWMYVDIEAPVKFIVLKIRNDSIFRRQLSAVGYAEWVLGDLRTKYGSQIVTAITSSGTLLAQNFYNSEFGEFTGFFDASTSRYGLRIRTTTCSRNEFIGRNRSLQNPAAMKHIRLSGSAGAGLDPCAAIHLGFDLAPGHSREIVFILGAGKNRAEAESLAQHNRSLSAAADALEVTTQYWERLLSSIHVTTPDPAVNFLANGWLIYQTLSSRIWGRTGYYQSSGAFGFRDQLQDVMSLVHQQPELLRKQLLLCASRQFTEGDVQHWWHPPAGRGVRTRCSDDYLWLPFALCRYIETTGDLTILNEQIPFLEGRPLKPEEESYYELPKVSTEQASLYQHAVRSILFGLRCGEHGLPLMGSGDWNDGMNLVGIHGKGESIWLGFFLFTVLKKFVKIARLNKDEEFAVRCDQEKLVLQQNIEANGWDGEWYRRAYFDDGTPLGSAQNSECKIDSIAQSWSVISGAGDPARARQAMSSLHHFLVRPEDGLITLLDPPFHNFIPNPGYIKGYVPGIRENGGQYTHAAIWAIIAFAKLGETELAWRLFSLINPVNHGCTSEAIDVYKIEPYVVAGDVYSIPPHTGRGGWSWYTGSAGWMYHLVIESLLGIHLCQGNELLLTPHLPLAWNEFTVDYKYQDTSYHILVTHDETDKIFLDEQELKTNRVPLVNDRQVHQIKVFVARGAE